MLLVHYIHFIGSLKAYVFFVLLIGCADVHYSHPSKLSTTDDKAIGLLHSKSALFFSPLFFFSCN